MKVGFIGLGRMGTGMAARLIAAGHQVAVYNRTPEKAKPLVDLGARAHTRIAEVCRGDAVFTMLANDGAVESVVLGSAGVIASLNKTTVHISSSTISVALAEKLVLDHQAAGQRFIAAPVFGRPEAAAAGKLFVMAAGAPQAVEACLPLLEAVGQRTFVMSEQPAAASLIKLSGNFLIAAVIETLGEALALVKKGGVDPESYLELLTSTLFSAPIYKTYGSLIVKKQFEPAGFAAALGYKDICLALAAAETLRVPMPCASLLRDRFLTLMARGGDDLDWSAIATLASEDAGEGSACRPPPGTSPAA